MNQETIEKAIEDGCKTLNEIFDATTAGVGACGGSCRRIIGPMLENKLEELNKLEEINKQAILHFVPVGEEPDYFLFVNALQLLRNKIERN